MTSPFKYVLFDLDNTLINREIGVRHLAENLYKSDLIDKSFIGLTEAIEIFVELDRDGHRPDKHQFFLDVIEAWGRMKRSPSELEHWLKIAPRDWYKPDPEISAFIGELNFAAVSWGIVTNGPPNQIEKADRMEVTIGAMCIVVDSIFGVSKPNPAIFLEAKRLIGDPDPSSVLFVGDNPEADIVGAATIGMKTAWIHRNRDWPTDFTPPDYTLSSPLGTRPLLINGT